MFLQKLKLAPALLLPVVVVRGTVILTWASPGPAQTAESRLQDRAESPADKPDTAPLDGISRASDPVDRALRDSLSPALAAADPYRLTFALIGLAKARSAAGDHNAALKTFRVADQVARSVKDQHLRRLAVMRRAVARGQIGDKVPACAALLSFAREEERLTDQARTDLMSMVIDFLDHAGFTDEAKARLKVELARVEATDNERFKDGGVYRLLPRGGMPKSVGFGPAYRWATGKRYGLSSARTSLHWVVCWLLMTGGVKMRLFGGYDGGAPGSGMTWRWDT